MRYKQSSIMLCCCAVCLAGCLFIAGQLLAWEAAGPRIEGYELKAEMKMEVVGQVQPNKPFDVVFTYKVTQEIQHDGGLPDTASIRMAKGVEFVTGDTLWIGFLEKDREYSLRGRFMVGDGALVRLQGVVCASEAVIPIGCGDLVQHACTGKFLKPIDFRSTADIDSVTVINVVDSGTVIIKALDPSLHDALRRPPCIDREYKLVKVEPEPEPEPPVVHYGGLHLGLDTADTARTRYIEGFDYKFVPPCLDEEATVSLAEGECDVVLIENAQYNFKLHSDSAILHVSCSGKTWVVILQ